MADFCTCDEFAMDDREDSFGFLSTDAPFPLPVDLGGTGADNADDARENLGLGTAARADLDATLTISGAAADAKATGDAIGNVNRQISYVEEATGNGFEQITGAKPLFFHAGNYRSETVSFAVGEQIIFNPNSTATISAITPCVEGDMFHVHVYSPAGTIRAVFFADSNMCLLKHYGAANVLYDNLLIAPANAAYAIFNNKITSMESGYYVYKGTSLSEYRETKNNKKSLHITWQQGTYSTSNGAGSSSTTKIRSIYYVPFKGFIRFIVPEGYKLYWYRYEYWNYQSFLGSSGSWLTGAVQIDDDGCLYKISLAKTDDSTFAPADAPQMQIEINDEANVLTLSNTEYLRNQILAILSCYDVLKVPSGTFTLSTGISLKDNQKIIGEGFASILRFSDVETGNAITMASGNAISGLQIIGSDTDYNVDTAPETGTNQHGIYFTGSSIRGIIENCWIHGFSGFCVYCYNSGTTSKQGLSIKDCYMTGSHGGLFLKKSEFHRVSNIDCNGNYIGAEIDGGNNTISGSNFSSNQIGLTFDNEDGTATNNTHGEVVGCIIQHNRIAAVKMNGVASGEMFVGCNIDNGGVNIVNSHRITFSACNFMDDFSIDITGGGLVHFADCMVRDYTKTHTTITNNTKVRFSDCYDNNGNLFDPIA